MHIKDYLIIVILIVTISLCFKSDSSVIASSIYSQYEREHIQALKEQNYKLERIAKALEKIANKK